MNFIKIANSTLFTIAQPAHGFSENDLVYFNGTSWSKAIASSEATCATAVVYKVIDSGRFKLITSGLKINFSGLTPNTWYYTHSTIAGYYTSTKPTFGSPVFYATEATKVITFPDGNLTLIQQLKAGRPPSFIEDEIIVADAYGDNKSSGKKITEVFAATPNLIPTGLAIETRIQEAIIGNLQADYVVTNVTTFDAALTDIALHGVGASVCLKRGTYDKGSAFDIPDVPNIRIFSEGGAVIVRPDADSLFRIGEGASYLSLDGLRMDGKDSGDYPIISFYGTYVPPGVVIKNNVFYENCYHFISARQYYDTRIEKNQFYRGFIYFPPTGTAYIVHSRDIFGLLYFNDNKVVAWASPTGIILGEQSAPYEYMLPNLEMKNNHIQLIGIDNSTPMTIPNGALVYITADAYGPQKTEFLVFDSNIFDFTYIDGLDYIYKIGVNPNSFFRGIIMNTTVNDYISTAPYIVPTRLTNAVDDNSNWRIEHNAQLP